MAGHRSTNPTTVATHPRPGLSNPFDRLRVVTVQSKILDQRRNVLVYVPAEYCRSRKHYPVLYLLHGGGGTELDWAARGRVHVTLDWLMGSGAIQPMIVAMPNDGLYGGGTFFTKWYDGTGDFEKVFLKEIVPAVEQAVRVKAGREDRAIAGLSMGGYAAMTLSLRNPSMFCAAASLSGLTMPASPAILGRLARRIFGPVKGRGTAWRRQRDPRYLVTRRKNRDVALHLNCGRNDFLLQLNHKFHRLLERLGRQHEYMEFAGKHDWAYWRKHVVEALMFVDGQFSGR